MDSSCKHYWEIGNNVRLLRQAKGYTQEILAERANLSLKGIQKVEAGYSGMRVDTLIKLAEALEVSLDTLVDVQEEDETRKELKVYLNLLFMDKTKDEVNFITNTINCLINNMKEYL